MSENSKKSNKSKLPDYSIQHAHHNFILQLYEKGLVSNQTLLNEFGIDWEKEKEDIRFEALSLEKIITKPLLIDNIQTKIEQARRNLEVLIKLYSIFPSSTEMNSKVMVAMQENMNIMQEVNRIQIN